MRKVTITLQLQYDPAQIESPAAWNWKGMLDTPEAVKVAAVEVGQEQEVADVQAA